MTDQPYTIRRATADDAADILAHLEIVRAEPGIHLITQPGESTFTVEDEQRFITAINNSDNSIFLIALDSENTIIGEAHFRGGERRLVRHTATLGISVLREWRGKGVGTALLAHAIEWARATDVLKRLELHVYAENTHAIHVYEKLGFEVEGRLRRGIFREGRFYDELVMGLLL
jgi:RimJ/RimL family protein N-acetyltransferase